MWNLLKVDYSGSGKSTLSNSDTVDFEKGKYSIYSINIDIKIIFFSTNSLLY